MGIGRAIAVVWVLSLNVVLVLFALVFSMRGVAALL